MYTKDDLKNDLKRLGINQYGTLKVHSSYKSIGEVDGGPETVLDSLSEYMEEGLLVLPTHTWDHVNQANPVFHVDQSETNVGILTELFRKRDGVIRSLHPTHSVGALGKDAKELMTILGEAALSDIDLIYAKFAEAFEKEYVSQGFATDRSIEDTLNTGWKLLSILPRSELKRIDDEYLDEYYGKFQ